MVQKLLCRWWYAMEWPAKEILRPAPPSYAALEGYPGVFICFEVGATGLRSARYNLAHKMQTLLPRLKRSCRIAMF